MKIIDDSKKVLKEIYQLLDINSSTLNVNIPINTISEKLDMSLQHVNLCIHYLIESGYLRGDYRFDTRQDATKSIFILPRAIYECENGLL